jgi:putative transposase
LNPARAESGAGKSGAGKSGAIDAHPPPTGNLKPIPHNTPSMHIYWRTHYHLIWATKDRLPLITPDRETLLYPYIHGKADALGGIVQAIGGIADHIHLVVSIPPTIAVTDFIKHIKGSSSHHLNQHPMPNSPTFAWQRGYGVITLGSKQCDRAIAYVHNQKHHHQTHTTIAPLELTQPA